MLICRSGRSSDSRITLVVAKAPPPPPTTAPQYVDGPIRVRPPDPFDLDREGDGWGCESG